MQARNRYMAENKMAKTVAILGGGASGLTAIKSCLEEGLNPVCFEWTKFIGGLWRYREDDVDGLASVMRSTIINSSKEMSAFSDFPPRKDFPNYMHNSKMIKYVEMYANHFGLVKYVKFRHEVISVTPTEDFDVNGRWSVTVRDIEADQQRTEVFDAVMVCTGHHVFPIIPTFLGQEKFQGKIIHTHSYKKPEGFENQNIVVVGIGNSGGDVAVELSQVAKQVYLSTRRGCWIIHRVGPKGKPFDAAYLTRCWDYIFQFLPYWLVCYMVERSMNNKFDHELYNIKPQHRIFGQHPMVNDALPNRILSGTVLIKSNIERFTSKGVIFEGEEEETEVDTVVLATGYEVKFPFISKDIVPVEENKVDLYKYVFPPHLAQPTLGFIGLAQPIGPLFPISEIQSRVFARVISGRAKLPSPDEMMADVKANDAYMSQRYFSGPRNTLQLDWVPYMEEVATLIGARPNMLKLFFTDPLLWWKCFWGPCLPYTFRIHGPHPWAGARAAIFRYEERVRGALNTRRSLSEKKELGLIKVVLGCFLSFIALLLTVAG